jgi:hypothetical protein
MLSPASHPDCRAVLILRFNQMLRALKLVLRQLPRKQSRLNRAKMMDRYIWRSSCSAAEVYFGIRYRPLSLGT